MLHIRATIGGRASTKAPTNQQIQSAGATTGTANCVPKSMETARGAHPSKSGIPSVYYQPFFNVTRTHSKEQIALPRKTLPTSFPSPAHLQVNLDLLYRQRSLLQDLASRLTDHSLSVLAEGSDKRTARTSFSHLANVQI